MSKRWVVGEHLGVALTGVCLIGLAAPAARAGDTLVGAEIRSAYVWRGITRNSTPVLQPTLEARGLGLAGVPLTFSVLGNLDIGDNDGRSEAGEFSEIDLSVRASLPKGFELGAFEYAYTMTRRNAPTYSTREVMLGWSASSSVLKPAVALHYDVDEIKDYFATFSLGHDLTLSEHARLILEAQAGLAGRKFAEAYGGTAGGFYHYNLQAKVVFDPTSAVGLTAMIAYTGSFDPDHTLPQQPVRFYGGFGTSLRF